MGAGGEYRFSASGKPPVPSAPRCLAHPRVPILVNSVRAGARPRVTCALARALFQCYIVVGSFIIIYTALGHFHDVPPVLSMLHFRSPPYYLFYGAWE